MERTDKENLAVADEHAERRRRLIPYGMLGILTVGAIAAVALGIACYRHLEK